MVVFRPNNIARWRMFSSRLKTACQANLHRILFAKLVCAVLTSLFTILLQETMHTHGFVSLGAEEGGRKPQDLLPHEGYSHPTSFPFD